MSRNDTFATLATSETFAIERERLRRGGLRGVELAHWIARFAPEERDQAIESLLEIRSPGDAMGRSRPERLEADLIDYQPSGVAAIARAILDAPIEATDVLIDVGSGLGKVAMVSHLLTGARCRGVEINERLVKRSSECANALGLSMNGLVAFEHADVREADLDDGTVFFLYCPFVGDALAQATERLRGVAARHAIVVCALGFDMPAADWLVARQTTSLWLTTYDSVASPRSARPIRLENSLQRLLAQIAID